MPPRGPNDQIFFEALIAAIYFVIGTINGKDVKAPVSSRSSTVPGTADFADFDHPEGHVMPWRRFDDQQPLPTLIEVDAVQRSYRNSEQPCSCLLYTSDAADE